MAAKTIRVNGVRYRVIRDLDRGIWEVAAKLVDVRDTDNYQVAVKYGKSWTFGIRVKADYLPEGITCRVYIPKEHVWY